MQAEADRHQLLEKFWREGLNGSSRKHSQ